VSGARPGIDQVLERVTVEWLAIPGVVGTGKGDCEGRPCLKVFVSERTREVEARIPPSAGGYPVRIEVTGRARAR
jgi:hypothetical protein